MNDEGSSIRFVLVYVAGLYARKEVVCKNVHLQLTTEVADQDLFEHVFLAKEIAFDSSFDDGKDNVSAVVIEVGLVNDVCISGFLDDSIDGILFFVLVEDGDGIFETSWLKGYILNMSISHSKNIFNYRVMRDSLI